MTQQQTSNQNNLHVAQMEYDNQKTTPGIAYALWFFLGVVGAHRFYAGDRGYALALLFTLGCRGAWGFVDCLRISTPTREISTPKRQPTMACYGFSIPGTTPRAACPPGF